MPPAFAL